MPRSHATIRPKSELPQQDGPSLSATLAVGVGTLLSAIAFAVSAFVSATADSAALPGSALSAEAFAGPVPATERILLHDLEPASQPDPARLLLAPASLRVHPTPAALLDSLQDLGRALPILRSSESAAAPASSGGAQPVAPEADRCGKFRAYVVERTTAPA